VMWHKFDYRENSTGNEVKLTSSLVVKGENKDNTAMAKTVGIPLAIAAKLVLTGKIKLNGMYIPTHPEIYKPILNELESFGIRFDEKTFSMIEAK